MNFKSLNSKYFYLAISVACLIGMLVAVSVQDNHIKNPAPSDLPIASNKPTNPATTLLFVGDIMLSRNVGTKIRKAADPNLPFKNLINDIAGADIAFGNLECPLHPGSYPLNEGLVFRCLVNDSQGIINAGFDILSTANNHSFDQGKQYLEFTIDYLTEKNIIPIGTNKSFTNSIELVNERNQNGKIIEKNNTKFGFLAYSYTAFNDGGKSIHPQIATMNDLDNLKTDISNLKNEGADIIVVSMHAGVEYVRSPNNQQIEFAHSAIDAGADTVIGHHPHWIQTIEIYNNKPIFYSLGNFIFDQMWSQDTREGLVVKLNIKNQKLKSIELIPVIIDNYCCPRIANDKEKQKILQKINQETDIINFP